MIKTSTSIIQVKEEIQKLKDKAVSVTVNMGRNKLVSYCGTVSGVYPALFTVVPSDAQFRGKTTYSYSEYMCGRVKLKASPTTSADLSV